MSCEPITRDELLASGFIRREQVEDNIVTLSDMRADGLWEQEPYLANWVKRTPEFVASRNEAQAVFFANQGPAEIALASALISLEADLPSQKDGPPIAFAPNGQRYVVVASEPHKEGDAYKGCATSANAIASWKRAMLEFAATNPGDTLWWRDRPEIGGGVSRDTAQPKWIVYSRLMIGTSLADQLMAKVNAGEIDPTIWDVQAGLITKEQIEKLGLVFCVATGAYTKPQAA